MRYAYHIMLVYICIHISHCGPQGGAKFYLSPPPHTHQISDPRLSLNLELSFINGFWSVKFDKRILEGTTLEYNTRDQDMKVHFTPTKTKFGYQFNRFFIDLYLPKNYINKGAWLNLINQVKTFEYKHTSSSDYHSIFKLAGKLVDSKGTCLYKIKPYTFSYVHDIDDVTHSIEWTSCN